MNTLGYIELTFEFAHEENFWTGICRELGTATYGESLPAVHAELAELVAEHFALLELRGERERFFKENGIEVKLMPSEESNVQVRIGGDRLLKGDGPFVIPEFLPMPFVMA